MSDSELSTTTGESGSESGSESSEPESKQNLDNTAASAREEFKKLTEATDKKNAALQRDQSTHSFEGNASSEGKTGANAKSAIASDDEDDSDSGSTGSESNSSVISPKPPRDARSGGSGTGNGEGTVVTGQHHDEELEMSSDTIDTTVYNQQLKRTATNNNIKAKSALPTTASGSSDTESSSSSDDMSVPNQSRDDMPSNEYEGGAAEERSPRPDDAPRKAAASKQSRPSASPINKAPDSDSDDSDDSDSDSTDSSGDSNTGGALKKKNYNNLRVSDEVKSLFQYVDAYDPSQSAVELPTILKPFFPDYVPCIGVPDVFLKMPRPDGKPDTCGLVALDEPTANQTDKDIFEMQLRSTSKVRLRGDKEKAVPCIEHASKKPEAVQQWITSIDELHAGKPAPAVVYSNPMPDINDSMQVWPAEFERYLAKSGVNFTADLDVSLEEFSKICCSLMDIPTHKGKMTESLHHFFTLWSDFRNNQHFQHVTGGLGPDVVLDNTDYRLSTPEAIEAAMMQSDHRPSTAEGIRQAMENSLADQRPSTSTHVKNITGNYRPDTAAAIAAVQRLEQDEDKDGK